MNVGGALCSARVGVGRCSTTPGACRSGAGEGGAGEGGAGESGARAGEGTAGGGTAGGAGEATGSREGAARESEAGGSEGAGAARPCGRASGEVSFTSWALTSSPRALCPHQASHVSHLGGGGRGEGGLGEGGLGEGEGEGVGVAPDSVLLNLNEGSAPYWSRPARKGQGRREDEDRGCRAAVHATRRATHAPQTPPTVPSMANLA